MLKHPFIQLEKQVISIILLHGGCYLLYIFFHLRAFRNIDYLEGKDSRLQILKMEHS